MKAKDYLSSEEIKELTQLADWKAVLEVLSTWGWITFAFLIAGIWPNPLTIIIALFIIGGKQLGCAILMHDASHRALFKSRKLNDFVANWFAGYPIVHDGDRYRPYHLKHHIETGNPNDPDLNLTVGYPAGRASFTRKVLRDLLGITGIKGYFGLFLIHLGVLKYNLGRVVVKEDRANWTLIKMFKNAFKNLTGPIISNVLIFAVLWLFNAPWLYAVWIVALLTTFQFSLRIRSIAEHSVVPDQLDMQLNTRTTYANFIERILFAPHHVNYHAEHHLLMTVPSYNLPKMHQLLKDRGFYDRGLLSNNYKEIINLAISG